jgi:hypothetical protein
MAGGTVPVTKDRVRVRFVTAYMSRRPQMHHRAESFFAGTACGRSCDVDAPPLSVPVPGVGNASSDVAADPTAAQCVRAARKCERAQHQEQDCGSPHHGRARLPFGLRSPDDGCTLAHIAKCPRDASTSGGVTQEVLAP